MLKRGLLFLAILAALMGAPSAALAAPPNVLLSPAVTPGTGTTLTTYVISVQYVSGGGHAASSVTATLAGRTVAMSLVAGTAVNGTWTAAVSLPAGTWPVGITATPSKGPEPTIVGPTIRVAALPPPATPRPGTPAPSPSKQAETGGATPSPTSAGTPQASNHPASSNPPGAVAASPAPPAAGSPATPGGAPPAIPPGATGGGTTVPASGVAAPAGGVPPASGDLNAPASSAAPTSSSSTTRVPSSDGSSGDGPDGTATIDATMIWTIMVGGLVAVAAVTLLGAAWLLPGRRRDDERDPMIVDGPSPEAAASDLLTRRSRLRARTGASEDPVLAAMGLDTPPSGKPRASQVHRGPAMRDASHRPPRRPPRR